MLDVRRAPDDGWRTPPFGAEIVEIPPFPAVVIARGARAVKGPLGVWLNAVEACRAVLGRPPVNLYVLAETDEILGSPHYRALLAKYRDRLASSDACWTPGAAQDAEGNAHVTLGYKGMIYLALRASGAAWGRGPGKAPIHGMARSVVDSPAWRLVQALATITGPDANDVRIRGFAASASPATADERQEMEEIRARFAGSSWQSVLAGVQSADVRAVSAAMTEADIYERYFFGPSFNLNGLRAGYTGPGTNTFELPHTADAYFDIRIPRTWKTADIVRALREHLDRRGFEDIAVDVFGAFDGSRVSSTSRIVTAARSLFDAAGVDTIWWPATGGGGPWSLFSTELGKPLLRDVGLGHGRASARDEYLVVEGHGNVRGMVDMALSHADFMLRMAEV
jgi:acetylornithine deacetylase/succinyl-diaminopimelate desuccinylase-like protein